MKTTNPALLLISLSQGGNMPEGVNAVATLRLDAASRSSFGGTIGEFFLYVSTPFGVSRHLMQVSATGARPAMFGRLPEELVQAAYEAYQGLNAENPAAIVEVDSDLNEVDEEDLKTAKPAATRRKRVAKTTKAKAEPATPAAEVEG